MSNTLVRVAKDGAVLLVHPTTLEAHQKVGWAVSDDQENTEDPGPEAKPKGKGKAAAEAEPQPEPPVE